MDNTTGHSKEMPPYTDMELQPIGGTWRQGRGKGVTQDLNPYTQEVFIEIPQADRRDLEEAYITAAEAQKKWGARGPGERATIMQRAARIMELRQAEIVDWLIKEAGSTRIKAILEWNTAHAVLLEASALPYQIEGRIVPVDIPGKESRVYRKPVGVVGVISPWNFPLQLSARSVAPALAVGNAVVLKPASDTPVTGGLLLARILEEAGVPQGVVSVLIGSGSAIGDAFVSHAVPRVISFTGSIPVGRQVARLAAEAPIIKRVELELGGNCPFVVLEDADLENAVEAAVFGKFLHQGQICMITNRFIVQSGIYEQFVDNFAQSVRQLKIGDPDDPETLIGPIINHKQLRRLVERIHNAREAGGRQVVGGEPQGLVLPPHVFADITNEQQVAREELFGPVAPIIRAHDEEEALRIANDTSAGLSSCIFTRDIERGTQLALRFEAGMAHVNDQPVNDLPYNPFGGEKNSGIGRLNGRWAIDAFTTEQWVTIQHTPRRFPADARKMGGAWSGG
ncbi:MAG: aldehyde dehydrogenase family protein [Desulfobacteraceae bacterium]|nr:MAG: aldehyde dehydrogenase family protein [Desulfobacteraceae bacterium]